MLTGIHNYDKAKLLIGYGSLEKNPQCTLNFVHVFYLED